MEKNVTQRALISLYARANAAGLWESSFMQRIFAMLYFSYKRHLEDSYALLIRQHPELFTGGHIIDVGANIGYTAVLFAQVASTGHRVFAFEPEKKNFILMGEIVRRKHLAETIISIAAAVGAGQGVAELWYNPVHAGDHRITTDSFQGEKNAQSHQEVSITSLDLFAANTFPGQPVSFIKIDVQGYETEVCRGMSGLLKAHPDATVGIEYDPDGIRRLGFSPEDLLDFFHTRGYDSYLLKRDKGLVRVAYAELTTDSADSYIDLIFSKRALAV